MRKILKDQFLMDREFTPREIAVKLYMGIVTPMEVAATMVGRVGG